MDTALPQKFPFILDRILAKANCTGNRVCTSCDIVVLDNSQLKRVIFRARTVPLCVKDYCGLVFNFKCIFVNEFFLLFCYHLYLYSLVMACITLLFIVDLKKTLDTHIFKAKL